MISFNKAAALSIPPALLAGLAAVSVLRPEVPPTEPPMPYSFSDSRLILSPASSFMQRLEIAEVGKAAAQNAEFRVVGQIIALSNTSGSLTGDSAAWVELDSQLSASAGLDTAGMKPEAAGIAYGMTSLAAGFASRIRAGQVVEVRRYGLKGAGLPGVIVRIIPRPGDGVDVVFRAANGKDWFPGTSCEVAFPSLQGHPVSIPASALVHEGAQEYVWKELSPGRFAAQAVSPVDASRDDISVLGLRPHDRIVARGAILLKPLLPGLSSRAKG